MCDGTCVRGCVLTMLYCMLWGTPHCARHLQIANAWAYSTHELIGFKLLRAGFEACFPPGTKGAGGPNQNTCVCGLVPGAPTKTRASVVWCRGSQPKHVSNPDAAPFWVYIMCSLTMEEPALFEAACLAASSFSITTCTRRSKICLSSWAMTSAISPGGSADTAALSNRCACNEFKGYWVSIFNPIRNIGRTNQVKV